MTLVLGIESSCDETACAVLDGEGQVRAEAVLGQHAAHARFGGVVPEIAARAHLQILPDMARDVIAQAGGPISAVAATSGPGLIGGLIVGSFFARGFAIGAGIPYIGVNHLEAHALTARIPGLTEGGAAFPYLLMLLSGGHCQCVRVDGLGDYTRLGGTIDDAVGEAFDKVGKMLGLGWPGGPALERLARDGDPARFALPRPLLRRPGCDFSFSGLKTAVSHIVARFPPDALPHRDAADIAAGFQAAVVEVLTDRAANAMRACPDVNLLVVAGGVAANTTLRNALREAADRHGCRFTAPPPRLCTDNAVMVAWAGIERLKRGLVSPLDQAPRPRWPLDSPDMRPTYART